MFNTMFHHVNVMQRGLDAAWLRQEVISHNIANVDTPNFRKQEVHFETMLRNALNSGSGLEGARTNERHIHINPRLDPTQVEAQTIGHTHFEMRMDGNNVDIDHEMNAMAANFIRYSALQTQITSEFNKLRTVIREGR